MTKLLLLPVVAAVLAACSSAPRDHYDRRVYQERERQNAEVKSALSNAPKWMTELPRSNSAVYENGSAVSRDWSMAVNKAKTVALGKVCIAAGGRVDQQSRMYLADREDTSIEISELAIRSFCPAVDVSGAEVVETRMVPEGNRFRAYVLIALPTGDANAIQRANQQRELRRDAQRRSESAQREMDSNRNLAR